ncbi:MAG: BrnA antitoxin family protein [Chromatiales bacterium]|jgi:predicted DNA binding CopG/RHH family protein|nr:BrnA antitoxin family protein [Chromatiales bacterium]
MKKARGPTEAELLASYEAGEWVSVARSRADLRKFEEMARATLAKDQRINIRLSSPVLAALRARAAEEGMPYQTLIASVLHKFATGRLVEKTPARSSLKGAGTRVRRDRKRA